MRLDKKWARDRLCGGLQVKGIMGGKNSTTEHQCSRVLWFHPGVQELGANKILEWHDQSYILDGYFSGGTALGTLISQSTHLPLHFLSEYLSNNIRISAQFQVDHSMWPLTVNISSGLVAHLGTKMNKTKWD